MSVSAPAPAAVDAPRASPVQRCDRTARTGASRYVLRAIALGYVGLLLLLPLIALFYRTFEHGLAPVWDALTTPDALHAFWLSLELVAIVVPLNTAFGDRHRAAAGASPFRGRALVGALIDLPFAISPVVVGLSLLFVYGDQGWLGNWLPRTGSR